MGRLRLMGQFDDRPAQFAGDLLNLRHVHGVFLMPDVLSHFPMLCHALR